MSAAAINEESLAIFRTRQSAPSTEDLSLVRHVYADGGVINYNPSSFGGTFAWIMLDHAGESVLWAGSGVVTPQDANLNAITNNYTELLACVEVMERLPDGWNGTIYTDSQVTMERLTDASTPMNGISRGLKRRRLAVMECLGTYDIRLLDGHPTQAQLASGRGKRGQPCSIWNVLCHQECQNQARLFRIAANGAADRVQSKKPVKSIRKRD